jgi:ribonucleoside-triphosphate reductase
MPMVKKVIKRNGDYQDYDSNRIKIAISKAFSEFGEEFDDEGIIKEIEASLVGEEISVEDIQDIVEEVLWCNGYSEEGREYTRYRYDREKERINKQEYEIEKKILGTNIENQNANIDEMSFGGRKGEASNIVMKNYALNHCMSKMARDNHLNNEIYIHDLDSYAIGEHNCAEGSMWVKIKSDGGPRVIKLSTLGDELGLQEGQLADVSKAEYEILSRDGWTKLINVTKRVTTEDEALYTIKTRSGLPLKLTGDHRLPVLENGVEKLKYVKDIKIGDCLLDVENVQLSNEELNEGFMDLTQLDDEKIDMRITNLTPLKAYLKFKYGITFAIYARENNFSMPPNSETMKLSDFKNIMDNYPLSFDILSSLRLKSCGSKHDYPLYIPYTKELAKLYAYIYADGGVYVDEEKSTFQLNFANTNEKLVDDFIDCYESVFGYRLNKSYATARSTSPCIRVTDGSRVIVKIFKDFAGAKKYGASDISVPDFVMNGSEDIKYAYLSAAIDADGSMLDRIYYTTCGDGYSDQFVLMLQSLGYHPHKTLCNKAGSVYHFGKKSGIRNFNSYTVSIGRNDEKYDLQSKMSTLKYNDSYVYKGLKNKFNETKVISIISQKGAFEVYDLETISHWFIVNNYVSHNCMSIPFDDLLANGFNTRQTDVRPANSVNTAFQLIAVIMQLQSLQEFGGVSSTHLDWTMVPYVRKSFYKHYKDGLKYIAEEDMPQYLNDSLSIDDEKYTNNQKVYKYALDKTEQEVKQGAEGLFHNLNC